MAGKNEDQYMTGSSRAEIRDGQVSVSELMACTGLECVSRLADGTFRPPAMAETLPFKLLLPEVGRLNCVLLLKPVFAI
jgi:hypothetical protein|tara:strand:- start:1 stop:237 length:237 start_codon:yes stop_codon:yes gene_type:complete